MLILPAIDILDGKAVRLLRGEYDKKTVYGEPTEFAAQYKRDGATELHVVDLNGARSGRTDNFSVVKDLVQVGLNVEVGGGIRNMETVERYLSCGVKRVILGTAAIKDPDFLASAVKSFGDAIAVGVDTKGGLVATDGWEKVSQTDSFTFCTHLRDIGVKTVVYTDVSTDGTLKGTNMDAFSRLQQIAGLNVIASGGITYPYEIFTLAKKGLFGAILGKALYEGVLTLPTALRAAEGLC
ncbi:MAG: 1-(5-phosphoribosyl)-5-[Clostridia bacterium]|nr:1-(5-phosphoribosyl)-5-[(5-phosphoribosylamino)methylideneamino]imidazole-4-carboxamide isomerase [Clostridia bacterium]